jgi:omega-6 fatty acid desaturase (delta-12 desaturase)
MGIGHSNAESPAARAAREWRTNLPIERRRATNRHGLTVFLVSASAYLALLCGVFLAPTWWWNFLCLLALPMAIGAMFVIGHDAAHLTLVRSYRLNHILGRLAFLPAYHPFSSWTHAHNVLHHGGTCLKQKQPDFPPLSKPEYDALPAWHRCLYRLYRTPYGVGLCYVFDFFGRFLLFPRRENRPQRRLAFQVDRLLVLAYFGLQLLAANWLTAHTPDPVVPRAAHAIIGVLAPWVLWIYFMGVVTFVQHTHPRTAWYDDENEWSFYHVQLLSTTHMVLPTPIARMLHNIMDHPAHHIDPTIPLYELPASQMLLEEQAPEHSIVERLTVREYLRICRTCKLYDFRAHRWLDFHGRPTSGSTVPVRASSISTVD